jgi:hypothetical protein
MATLPGKGGVKCGLLSFRSKNETRTAFVSDETNVREYQEVGSKRLLEESTVIGRGLADQTGWRAAMAVMDAERLWRGLARLRHSGS